MVRTKIHSVKVSDHLYKKLISAQLAYWKKYGKRIQQEDLLEVKKV